MPSLPKLTFENVTVRAVSIPMKRPIVAKVGSFPEWPFILIDVTTSEGIVGCSYLEPYLKNAVRYIGPAIQDMGEAFKGRVLAPLDLYRDVIGSLHLLGRQGVSVIAAAGPGHGNMGRACQGCRAAGGATAGQQCWQAARVQHQRPLAAAAREARRRGARTGHRRQLQRDQGPPWPPENRR